MPDDIVEETKEPHLSFDRVSNIPVDMTVEIGKATLSIEELININDGDVIPLNKLKDEPFDIKVNGFEFAKGKIMLDEEDRFYIKVIQIIRYSHE